MMELILGKELCKLEANLNAKLWIINNIKESKFLEMPSADRTDRTVDT